VAITYSTTVLNNRLQQVINAVDGGVGSGFLVIGNAGLVVTLVSITLAKPCGTIAGGILTLSTPATATAINSGTAALAELTDSTGLVIASGLTVGTTGTNLIISRTAIVAGDIVSLTSGTITGN
jgi:hypothetical protein